MSKEPSPRADALRAMREQKCGHLQATATPLKRKLIPFAGKEKNTGRGPDKSKTPRKRSKSKRKSAA